MAIALTQLMDIGVEIKQVEASSDAVSILMEIKLRQPSKNSQAMGRIVVNVEHKLSEDSTRFPVRNRHQPYRPADRSVGALTHAVVALRAVK